ncbi:MAG: type II secretion system protein GspE, partial [Betaproteobacteria bacterium]
LAQRLVRTLCPACRAAAPPSAGESKIVAGMGLPKAISLWTAPGCVQCNDSGYRGRSGIYELLVVDDAMRRMIHDGASEPALRDAALHAGMRSLRVDGGRWIEQGTTALAELMRVTRDQ